jgi:hypothetical protein
MKTFFTKNRTMIWVVIILMVLYMAIIVTLFFRNYHDRRILGRFPASREFHRAGQGFYLQKELDLTGEQFQKLHEARMAYQQASSEIRNKINALRGNYLDELMKSSPDQAILLMKSDSIGKMHSLLIQQTGVYYNQIRQLCRDDQVTRLNTFFKRAVQMEGMGMFPGRSGRNMNRAR